MIKQLFSFPFTTVSITLLVKWRQSSVDNMAKAFQDWGLLVGSVLRGVKGLDRAQWLTANSLHSLSQKTKSIAKPKSEKQLLPNITVIQ